MPPCSVVAAVTLMTAMAAAAAMHQQPNWLRPGCHLAGNTRKMTVPGCPPFAVTTNGCRGFCDSWAFPSSPEGVVSKHQPVTSQAQCCAINETKEETFTVPCFDGDKEIVIQVATSCACDHCRKY